MDTVTTKIEESRVRLVQQGTQFVQQTSAAVTAFVGKSKKASERFATDTRKAGHQLATDAEKAGRALATGVSVEARMWLDALAIEQRLSALPKLPSGLEGTPVPARADLERQLLEAVEAALRDLGERVTGRLAALEASRAAQLPATTEAPVADAKPARKGSNGANGSRTSNGHVAAVRTTSSGSVSAPSAPISGYDDMSAKDIVTRLERLTDEKAAAILAYEQANKKRATIVRAAEQRLAAEA